MNRPNLGIIVIICLLGILSIVFRQEQQVVKVLPKENPSALFTIPIEPTTSKTTVTRTKENEISTEGTRKLESNIDYTKPEVINRPITVDYSKALQLINQITNLIYQRFEFHHTARFQFFLESSNLPIYAWDLIKYKVAQKIIQFDDANAGKILPASTVREFQQYLMTFGGSSVTAGHDNYYHQSYPFVFERRMVDIFANLGMKLMVHNIAQGSNNCRPADYCYEAMGGDNPDFVVWEQSFNCGRSKDIHEYMARVAYWSGGIIYYSASGAFLTNGCKTTTDKIPWTREEWTPESVNIATKYEVTPQKTSDYRKTLSAWYDDGNSVSRFTNQVYGGLYRGVGPHGYSVWGHSSSLCNNGTGCDAVNVKGECFENGGPHWMVAETSYYANEPNKHGKTWHPPAGMHLMRGEVLAYNFAHILADAIFMIQEDLKTISKADAFQKYKKAWEELRVPIPEKALHLSANEGNDRAYCYTNFRPHFNPQYLLDKIVLKSSTWVSRVLHHDGYSSQQEKYGYQDTRISYEGKAGGHEIHLRLDKVRSGEVRICGYDVKESLIRTEMFLDPHYSFSELTPTNQTTYQPTEKRHLVSTKFVGDECYLMTDVPKGDGHVLTIKTLAEPIHHLSVLSHVIIF